jgi:hypothetical protein
LAADPTLSIVVGSNGAPGAVERFLAALEPQVDGTEVLVCEPEPSPDALRERYPFARFVHVPGALVPQLWRAGIDASGGDVVAMTISPMQPAPDWVATIRERHRTVDVVGGAIDPGDDLRLADWAEYFCRFARDMTPFEAHDCVQLPGDNAAYKRRLLERTSELHRNGFWEDEVNRRLHEEGETLLHDPAVVVRLGRSAGFRPFVRQRLLHGRTFGRQRGAEASTSRNLARVLLSFAVPAVLLARTAREVLGRRRHTGRFVASLPVLVAYDVAWAAGEALGHLDSLRER